MKLPHAEKAIIETEKLSGYLLSPTHPVGRFKAAVFAELGYYSENWGEFERSLRKILLNNEAVEAGESQYGKKYAVQGMITGPSGNSMPILTVWVILKEDTIPRFVTAYPGGQNEV